LKKIIPELNDIEFISLDDKLAVVPGGITGYGELVFFKLPKNT
jgi:hypothetical protein